LHRPELHTARREREHGPTAAAVFSRLSHFPSVGGKDRNNEIVPQNGSGKEGKEFIPQQQEKREETNSYLRFIPWEKRKEWNTRFPSMRVERRDEKYSNICSMRKGRKVRTQYGMFHKTSVADTNPVGSLSSCRIRIRNFHRSSGSRSNLIMKELRIFKNSFLGTP
jgi:hypothetical protein